MRTSDPHDQLYDNDMHESSRDCDTEELGVSNTAYRDML